MAFLIGLLFCVPAFAVGPSLTYHGRLLRSDGTAVNTVVSFKIQIRTPGNEDCLLYEETQTQDLAATAGVFSLALNSTGSTRTDGGSTTYGQIFSNRATMTFAAGKCTVGTSYVPAATDGRALRVSFNDGTFAGWEDTPVQALNYVPKAIDSLQVGGFTAASILRVQDGTGPQTASALSPANFTELLALINGTSTQYTTNSTAAGAAIPVVAGSPATPVAGSLWFDSTSHSLVYYNGTANQSVGTPTSVSGNVITSGTIGGTTAISTSGTIQTSGSVITAKTSLYDHAGAGPGFVALQAPADIAGSGGTSYTLTLPNTKGTSNQVLSTDGTGVLSWITPLPSGVVTTGTYKSVTVDTYGRVTAGTNPTTLSGFGITDAVLNNGGTPGIKTGVDASKGSAGTAGNLYVASDTFKIYRDNGTTWDTIASASGTGGTVTSVGVTAPLVVATATSTPALSITQATTSTNGYVSSTDWNTFNNKITATASFTGDVGGTYDANTVNKIKGMTVSAAPSVTGQVLRYNGTNITPNFVSMADLRSNITGTTALASSCASSQTLTYNSASDNLTCTNIAIANTQVSGLGTASTLTAGTGNNNVVQLDGSSKMPAVDGSALTTLNATNISSGTLAAARLPSIASASMAVVNTRHTCVIVIGSDNGPALANSDIAPQGQQCYIPAAATIVEINVRANAGTPSVLLQRVRGASTVADLMSGSLATAASGAAACVTATVSQTCIDGTTSSGTLTLSNTALTAGDWIQTETAVAGGAATRMSIAITYTIN